MESPPSRRPGLDAGSPAVDGETGPDAPPAHVAPTADDTVVEGETVGVTPMGAVRPFPSSPRPTSGRSERVDKKERVTLGLDVHMLQKYLLELLADGA